MGGAYHGVAKGVVGFEAFEVPDSYSIYKPGT